MAGHNDHRKAGTSSFDRNWMRKLMPVDQMLAPRFGNAEKQKLRNRRVKENTYKYDAKKMEENRQLYETTKRELEKLDENCEEFEHPEQVKQAKRIEETEQAKLLEQKELDETTEREQQNISQNESEVQQVLEVIYLSNDDIDDDDSGIIEVNGPFYPEQTPSVENMLEPQLEAQLDPQLEAQLEPQLEAQLEPQLEPPEQNPQNVDGQDEERDDDDDSQVTYKMFLRWRWNFETTHFLRKYETFEEIFKHYSERDEVAIENISFETYEGRLIYPEHTPDSIELRRFELLTGVVLEEGTLPSVEERYSKDGRLAIKIQLKNRKQNMCIRVDPKAPLRKLMLQAAEKLQKNFKKLKFYFDGERVNPEQTATDLELQENEIIDLAIDE